MGLTIASLNPALKVHYGPQELKSMSYMDRPGLALIDKYENFGGDSLPLPVKFAKPQNLAAQFGAASRINSGDPATSSSALAKFSLTRVRGYANAYIGREAMLASKNDVNSFVRGATMDIDGAVSQCSDDLHIALYGNGHGERGVVGSVDGTGLIVTLSQKEDISRFEVGMAVQFGATASDVNSALAAEIVTVTAVDRSAGAITISGAVTGITTGAGPNKSIFRYGDRLATAITSSDYLKLAGLDGWLPAVAPGPTDNWFGVNRSVDTDRLAGIRVTAGASRRKTLMHAAIETGRQGARGARLCLANPTDVEALMFEYEDKVQHDTVKAPDLELGFESIKVVTPMGRIDVVADHQCPVGTSFLLTPSSWKLYSIEGAPHMVGESGKFLRSHTDDTFKVEFAWYGNLGCDAPGKNARITW